MPAGTITVNAQIGNISDPTSIGGFITDQSLSPGGVVYMTSQNNPLTTPPTVSGFNVEAVSPDGKQVYAIDSAQNSLVAINTSDLSQRQLFEQGFNGVTGLTSPASVAVSPDGAYVYVSGSDGVAVSSAPLREI